MRSKKVIISILVIAMLLALSAAGYFFIRYNLARNDSVPPVTDNPYDEEYERSKTDEDNTIHTSVTNYDNRGELSEIGSFSTYYGDSDENRKNNISLAVSYLDGVLVESGNKFSFNEAVGKRTEERGFKNAKVILDGEYVTGIGGGICQVSTTLFNAWALSGLKIAEVKCHTLPSRYVEPSRDAAVSEFKDLVLENNSAFDAYISMSADGEDIKCSVYGIGSGLTYGIEIEIVKEIKPSEVIVVEQVHDKNVIEYEVLRKGKNGLYTKAYLIASKDGKIISKEFLREDWYSPVKPKILKKVPASSVKE